MSRPTFVLSRSAARKGGVGAALVALAAAGALVVPTATTANAAEWRPLGIPASLVSSGSPVDGDLQSDATMDQAGNGTAVWLSDGVVRAATREVGKGNWEPSERLSTLDVDASDPTVAVDADGLVTAAWVEADANGDRVFTSDRTPTGSWSDAVAVSPTNQNASDPQVAVNDDRTVTIVWTADNTTETWIQGIQRRATQEWGDLVVQDVSVRDPAVTGRFPHLAGGGKTFIVAWTADDGAKTSVLTRQQNGVPQWTAEVPHSAGGADATAEDVALDGDDSATVLWRENDNGDLRMFARTQTFGDDFSPAVGLSGAGQDTVTGSGLLATNATGDLFAAWSRFDGEYNRVQTKWFNRAPGGTWSIAVRDFRVQDVPAANARPVATTVAPDGRPTMVVATPGASKLFRLSEDSTLAGPGIWSGSIDSAPQTSSTAPVALASDSGGDIAAFSTYAPVGGDTQLVERIYDNTKPTASTGAVPSISKTLRVRPTWSATDTWSDISKYAVTRTSTPYNSGTVTRATSNYTPATRAATYTLSAGRTYCFTTVSTDAADNVSAPTTTRRCTTTPVDERSMTRSTGWTNKSASGYYRNTYRTTNKRNATLTLPKVTTTELQLMAAKGPRNGTVAVYFRGVKRATWHLAAARNQHATLSLKFSKAYTGKLVVKVVSGDTRVRRGKRVIVTHHPVRIDGLTALNRLATIR